MGADNFDEFLDYLEQHAIASCSSLRGCTPNEIAALEQKYGITLPTSYRQYLEFMGHESGQLFFHDHLAASYSHILEMTAKERDRLRDESEGNRIELPADALIIWGRLGEQFEFIRCNNLDDSPVWYYSEWDREIKQVHDSVLECLESSAAEARHAIADGYFDVFPKGTRP